MPQEYSIGFDLGGTKMFAVVYDREFRVLGSSREATNGYEGPKAGIARILEVIALALEDAGVEPAAIGSLGIGCPGVVDFESGVLRHAPNLGWRDVAIGDAIAGKFGWPVAVLNDVDAGTFGEYRHGAGRGARSLLGVFPGTGVGGGFVYDGKILRGKRASCMEIGNIRLLGSTLEGAVGEPVRLESLASRLNMAGACAIEAFRGRAPYILEKAGTDIKLIKSGTMRRAIENGDEAVESILRRSIEYLGIGIATAVDLLGPDAVVVGGGLAEKMPDYYKKHLRKTIELNASAALVEDLQIEIAELGDHAVAIGAAACAADGAAG